MLKMKCQTAALMVILATVMNLARGDDSGKRLFDDLMENYNKVRRPGKHSDTLHIQLGLKLSQIIDVHEKNQIMTTSVWLKQIWQDANLRWDPARYGNHTVLYMPSEYIWVPDLVLYNNADSKYNITIPTKAIVKSDGTVQWEPPAIFKSMCSIDVEWFPFDEQECLLKFGSWTYDERFIDLTHLNEAPLEYELSESGENVSVVEQGIDMSDYYPSVEWEVLAIPARRHGKNYPSCCPNSSAYIDITYYLALRRKPKFYTINLVIPCVGFAFLTVLVFYLPSESCSKVNLCISILVSLTVFFLLLTEIIPATSLVLPLIGKYLLFTMVLVSLSVFGTVVILNMHYRTPATHEMPYWTRRLFLDLFPRILRMRVRKPRKPLEVHTYISTDFNVHKEVRHACANICTIAHMLKVKRRSDKMDADWAYAAQVLDRLLLWAFSIGMFIGTVLIIGDAPVWTDRRMAIDQVNYVDTYFV